MRITDLHLFEGKTVDITKTDRSPQRLNYRGIIESVDYEVEGIVVHFGETHRFLGSAMSNLGPTLLHAVIPIVNGRHACEISRDDDGGVEVCLHGSEGFYIYQADPHVRAAMHVFELLRASPILKAA